MNPLDRFSDRVENYVRFRPSYPDALFDFFTSEYPLARDAVVADMGAGTGIFSRKLLEHGFQVKAVEPNVQMRLAAKESLSHFRKLELVPQPAEETSLPDASLDAIFAAQAFHWFDPERARTEWTRILKPGAPVFLIWNDRDESASPFLAGYEKLLQDFGTDYCEVRSQNTEQSDIIQKFFAPQPSKLFTATNVQTFDFEGLKGRLLSSSYAPQPGSPAYEPMMRELKRLFTQTSSANQVAFQYLTRVHHGRLNS